MFVHSLRALALVSICGSAVEAAQFAAAVTSYTPGTGAGVYTDPNAALGSPAPLTGVITGFPNILNPFSPAYEPNELVGIGANGSIVIDMGSPIRVLPGIREFGVITNAGLNDISGNGQNYNPAENFNSFVRVADVSLSATGLPGSFVNFSRVGFRMPANFFVNAQGPYADTPPSNPIAADFGKEFAASLSVFDGLNFPQTIAAFDGSGGGTWLDVDSTGLSEFRYIRFLIPGTPPGSDGKLFIDAVVANNLAVVPEPAVIGLMACACLLVARGRR